MAQTPIELLSDDQILQLIEMAPVIKAYLANVEELATKRALSGKPIKGLKLVKGRGMRKWNLEEDEIAERLIKIGIPRTSVYTKGVVSPAQISNLSWTKRDGTVKKISPRQLKSITDNYISVSEGSPKLVSEDDPRPEIKIETAENLFIEASGDQMESGDVIEVYSGETIDVRVIEQTTGSEDSEVEQNLPNWLT